MARKLEGRRDDILAAATGLLSTGGMEAMTTTALADAAHCSKKTIYALFPDKDRLLAAIVQRQAETVSKVLEAGFSDVALTQTEARQVAIRLGAALLELLLSPASVAINRAAASDQTGRLGTILRTNGRDRLAPKISALLKNAVNGGITGNNEADMFPIFYGLLFADRQIGAILGAGLAPMDEHARQIQARKAIERLEKAMAGN